MTQIVVRQGKYGNKDIVDIQFTMVFPPKMGKNGLYVTVNGEPLGMDRNVRIMLDTETDLEFMHAADQPVAPVKEVKVKEQVETDEEIMDRMRKRFQVLDGMTIASIEGHVRAMIVTGPPGVGKSFGIEQVIESMDVMEKMMDQTIIQDQDAKIGVEKVASASPLGLYQLLWEYHAKGSVLVLDDSDTVLYDEAGINMMKAATDSGAKRTISWRTESRILDERGIPERFEFQGAIIFITNLDFEKARGRIGEHLKAIVSRCHYLDMGIHGTRERFLRCKQIVRDGMLADYKFDDVQIDEILTYIHDNQLVVRELSLRMVKKIADLVKMDPTGWRDYADQTCLRGR